MLEYSEENVEEAIKLWKYYCIHTEDYYLVIVDKISRKLGLTWLQVYDMILNHKKIKEEIKWEASLSGHYHS